MKWVEIVMRWIDEISIMLPLDTHAGISHIDLKLKLYLHDI